MEHSIRPYKFLIIPVLQKVNDEGVVIDEIAAEQPRAVFGIDGLRHFADTFELELEGAIFQRNGEVNAS